MYDHVHNDVNITLIHLGLFRFPILLSLEVTITSFTNPMLDVNQESISFQSDQLIPYNSLKLSGTKIFVDFVDFQAPTKILSLKFSYKLANPTNLYCMRFAMAH